MTVYWSEDHPNGNGWVEIWESEEMDGVDAWVITEGCSEMDAWASLSWMARTAIDEDFFAWFTGAIY